MSKNFIRFEIGVVLLLSLGTSTVYSLLKFAEALLSPKGIGGTRTDLNPSQARAEFFDFSYQLIGILFAVAPAILVLYLLRRDSEKAFDEIGIWPISRTRDLLRGLALAAVIGIPGLALYASARALGLAAQVVPADLSGYWWTVPMLLLSAVRAAIQEEVIMVAYLYKRFDQLGLKFVHQQLISATIRALYHSYQGFAGIVGNFVMGLIFGWAYRRWGRVMPLILAHFFLDAVSFVGYALLAKQLASLGGIF
jgi:membrane protease YdiL (CAAX protease family)